MYIPSSRMTLDLLLAEGGLFDLEQDPHELHNLSGDPDYVATHPELLNVITRGQMTAVDTVPLPTGTARKCSTSRPGCQMPKTVDASRITASHLPTSAPLPVFGVNLTIAGYEVLRGPLLFLHAKVGAGKGGSVLKIDLRSSK